MEEPEEMQVERLRDIPEEEQEEPSVDADKLSYEIFSILESKFLFGYADSHQLWLPEPGLVTRSPSLLRSENSIPKPSHQRGKVCILCIDGGGGGLRGLLPGRALAHLEACLRRISGDPDARLADFFDLAAGTGAGGLFAAMLFAAAPNSSRPLFHAEDTWRLVADHAPRIFRRPGTGGSFLSRKKRPLHKATAAMESMMKSAFGEEMTLKDTMKPVLVSCYDLKTSSPFLFSRADALESESYDFRLWEVGRAAWAEPGRFEPAEVRSLDGSTSCAAVDSGSFIGGPAAAAVTHVLHNKQEFPFVRGVEDIIVLSIGGGGGGGADDEDIKRMKRWGPKEWARPIAHIASDGAADLVDHAVARAFGNSRLSNYARIQAAGPSFKGRAAEEDYDPSPTNVRAMLAQADEMLKQRNIESVLFEGKRLGQLTNAEKLELFAAELVAEHRSRGSRIGPTVAIKQVPPKPPALR